MAVRFPKASRVRLSLPMIRSRLERSKRGRGNPLVKTAKSVKPTPFTPFNAWKALVRQGGDLFKWDHNDGLGNRYFKLKTGRDSPLFQALKTLAQQGKRRVIIDYFLKGGFKEYRPYANLGRDYCRITLRRIPPNEYKSFETTDNLVFEWKELNL